MRVRFAVEGGLAHFPGLAEGIEIDLPSLPEAEAAELAALLERAARLAAAPARRAGTSGRGADRRTYRITLERPEGQVTLRLEEPFADAELGRLVRTLESLVRRLRRARAGGPS